MRLNKKILTIRCNNPNVHQNEDRDKGEGNILLLLKGDSIFIKCSNHHCSVWNKITFNIPGVRVDFSNASFVQKPLKRRIALFEEVKAPVIIEDK